MWVVVQSRASEEKGIKVEGLRREGKSAEEIR